MSSHRRGDRDNRSGRSFDLPDESVIRDRESLRNGYIREINGFILAAKQDASSGFDWGLVIENLEGGVRLIQSLNVYTERNFDGDTRRYTKSAYKDFLQGVRDRKHIGDKSDSSKKYWQRKESDLENKISDMEP